MTAADIIQKLGGDAPLARALGAPLTTVNSWKRANFIPEWRQPKLLELAAQTDVALSTADFPTVTDRIPRRAAA